MNPEQLLAMILAQVQGMEQAEAARTLRDAAARLRRWTPAEPVTFFGLTVPNTAQQFVARTLAAEAEYRASVIEAESGLTSAPPD